MQQLFKRIKLLTNGKYKIPYCSCLFIEDEINCLIDSSPPDEEMIHLENRPIDMIINSHAHTDHCSRNYCFPTAKVLLHPFEHQRVVSGETYLHDYGFNHFPDNPLKDIYLDAVKFHSRAADGELTDGQVISTGNVEIQVMHLPGHTSGHCGFIFPREGFIFTADIHPDLKPFYAMIDSDIDEFIISIEKIRQLNPDILVAGHGSTVVKDKIPQRLAAYRDELFLREEKILKLIKAGKHTVEEMAGEAITFDGKFPAPQEIFFLHECVMDWKHLQRLERLGKVVCEDNKYYLI